MENELNRPLTRIEYNSLEKLKLKWKELSVEDIILDGLYSKSIRLVKEYFEKYLKVDLKSSKIVDIGLKSVVQLLADRDLVGAEFLLNQMNYDVNQKIYQICFFTPYKQLRDYLTGILIERNKLNAKELEIVEYVKKLELAYPCRSFEQTQYSIKKFESFDQEAEKDENFITKELVRYVDQHDIGQTNDLRYSHVILEWLKEWSEENKNKVLAESLILKPELCEHFEVDQKTIWSVLIEMNDLKKLTAFIDSNKLTQDMIDLVYEIKLIETKETLLNYLAQLNLFCSQEKSDFYLYINRLSSSLTFFDKKLFQLKSHEFHVKFLKYLTTTKNDPSLSFVWSYLNFYESVNSKSANFLITDSNQVEFDNSRELKLMLAFRPNIYQESLDPSQFFFNLSIKNLQYNLKLSDEFKLSDLFTENYKNYHSQALALSLYTDVPLAQTESKQIEHLLDEYPALRVLIDSKPVGQVPSIYTLLQEHTFLDMSKCLAFQKANNYSLFKNDDTSYRNSILSFENEEFVKKFGFKDKLDYDFFIKQGRPIFAYHHFMQEQLKKYGKPHKTLMEEARLRANLILLENFLDDKLVISCIFFIELLGTNTFKVKLYVHMMKILNEYYKKHGMDEKTSAEKCISIFVDEFSDELDSSEVVKLFEHVLTTNMIENYDEKNMFSIDASFTWLPLMCFCKINNLPYSLKYLSLCAESNQWLMFLIFSQLYQIPKQQVISSLEYFTNTGLKQHLEYALHNVITSTSLNDPPVTILPTENQKHAKKTSSLKSQKENKFTNFIKKKIAKNFTSSKQDSSTSSSNSGSSSETESDSDSKLDLNKVIESVDFYELLLMCENSPDPVQKLQLEALKWSTPVLSVFACFYPQHDKISLLTTFLYASMKIDLIQTESVKNPLFDLNDLKEAILIAAEKFYLRTILNSIKIFIPKTVLDFYVEFLFNVFVVKDIEKSRKFFTDYKNELIRSSLNKHHLLIQLEWYEDIINKLTRVTILKCNTIDDLFNFNNILGPENEFRRLIKLVYILKNNGISVSCENWLEIYDKSEQFNEICFKVLEELLKIEKFDEAEDLASYCELSKDRIHLARIGKKIEVLRLRNDFEEILEFWKNSHIQLMKIGIKDSDFIDFLKFQNSRSNLMLERIVLLNLIGQLCPSDTEVNKNLRILLFDYVVEQKKRNETNNMRDIFKKMLLFGTLKADPVKELVQYIMKEGTVNDFSDTSTNLNEQDKDALNILLYNLVDIGKLTQAYVIAKHFNYFNQDFRILLNMIYICLDLIKPEDLDYEKQALDTSSIKGIRLTNILRSMSKHSDISNENAKDKIEFLEKLVDLCNYGNKFSKRIKLDFRLSTEILKINYTDLINVNKWVLFKKVLYSSNSNRFEILKEFVKTYDLDVNKLADFMLNELMFNFNLMYGINKVSNGQYESNSQLMFDLSNNYKFSKFITIFDQSINLFGVKLLEKSKSLLNESKIKSEEFNILTELLIRSNDCFNQSCSMEGISNVLETCKLCASKLEKAGEFNIMIRLLTGIAHFSEMNYIMDILWNNHQFEMLFGKGIEKDNRLKLALLDYLKRYHPNDNETYTMVTLNFTMHREIAAMLEEAAYQQLKLLENKNLENTSEILTYLQSILQYFSDAAQSYMKEDCVKLVERCIKKARLIALQISFLSSGIIVVNLNQSSVSRFINNHPKFWESYIVSEAYDKKNEWPLALFNQYILNNNEKYLQDFKTYMQLKEDIIEDVSNRYKLWIESNKVNQQSVDNMKQLLKYCKDIFVYYRLVCSLDFKDLLEEIQTKPYASIINDMIMNKKLC